VHTCHIEKRCERSGPTGEKKSSKNEGGEQKEKVEKVELLLSFGLGKTGRLRNQQAALPESGKKGTSH